MTASKQQPRNFRVTGLDCAEEVAILKREVGPVVGGPDRLSFDILRGRMTVSAEAERIESQRIIEAVARTGMRAETWSDSTATAQASGWSRWGRLILTTGSGLAIVAALAVQITAAGGLTAFFRASSHVAPLSAQILFGVAIVLGGWLVVPKAWHAVRRRRPDMNLLMTIAVLGAVGIGEWFEAATVAFLFSVSLLLESWSVGRARHAISALMDLAPPFARVRNDAGQELQVAPDQVVVGSVVVVRPGERIPIDGEVLEGASHVNQAPITGESLPVVKEKGAPVYAGTINGDGALTIRCTKAAQESTMANIIRMVGQAHSRRAPSEQWVEKFAAVYTPMVMLLALVTILLPPLVFSQPWQPWLYNGLVLLVIACPCALVIATPVTVVASLASAARQGVLIKGGVFVEVPARLKAIAFDKTGTLTSGQPTVVQVVPLAGHSEQEVLERAAALEARSNHPLAKAIVEYAWAREITPTPADNLQVIQGKGAQARYQGRDFWLGSHRLLEERQQGSDAVNRQLEELSGNGRSVVVIGNDQHVCGLIALADSVRPECAQAMHALRDAGVEHLVMLTGDNVATARAIAQQVGIDQVHAELLPEDKVAVVEQLVHQHGDVAMIGDGVNDAPALARATLGIAMGAVGSDAAIETADVALMADDLAVLPWVLEHSRRTVQTIRQNIFFALSVKALFVALTFSGAASLWAAIAADMGTSLLVIGNGLRLLRRVAPGSST